MRNPGLQGACVRLLVHFFFLFFTLYSLYNVSELYLVTANTNSTFPNASVEADFHVEQ